MMNDIFDKIRDGAMRAKDEAQKLTKVAVQKTGNAVSKAKLTYAVSETESKINAMFTDLGEILYKEYKRGAEFPDEIGQICRQIERLYEEIDTVREQIAKITNAVICPACSEYNQEDSMFCAKCGKKLKEESIDFE